MIRHRLPIGVLLLAMGLGLVAACGSSGRPSELSLNDVQVCDLISLPEVRQLGVRPKPGAMGFVPGVDLDGTSCYYLPYNATPVTISAITNHGIERWMDGTFDEARFKDVAPIHGFRTIKVWYTYDLPSPDHSCSLFVDVAGGQSLRIRVAESFDDDDPPTCRTARRFAEEAMEGLIARN